MSSESTPNNSMGPLSTKLSPIKSETKAGPSQEEVIYYAVYGPPDVLGNHENDLSECDRVFDNKEEVLKFIKKNKKMRFKAFKNFQDAQNFAYNRDTIANTSLLNLSSAGTEDTATSSSSLTPTTATANIEKPSPFKSLRSQDLVKLRKLIEKGNVTEVKKLIWENPRYLVSSSDCPTILHEGCKYNALHVCAKSGNAEMMSLILETVGNPEFTNLLYDVSSENQSYIKRSDMLLDFYVNNADKGMHDTPLHFASKHGSIECVQLLVSCRKVNTNAKNKEKQTPFDVVCSRSNDATESKKSTIRKLISEDQYYVPIWSSGDACDLPIVGPPCKTNITPEKAMMKKDELDVTSPTLEIKAFAGPMSESDARMFRNKWKREVKNYDNSPLKLTPKKNLNTSLSSNIKSPPSIEKSFEFVGRKLALENKFEWKENWPFLKKCIDIQSQQGLDTLENYIRSKYMENLAVIKKELELKSPSETSSQGWGSGSPFSPIEKLCDNFQHAMAISSPTHLNLSSKSAPSSTSSSKSYLCVEKSCETFSNRLLQGLKVAAFDGNKNALIKTLRQEAKHLNKLCVSFAQDDRFQNVSMDRIHNKIGRCLVSLLCGSCPPECCEWIVQVFSDISKKNSLSICHFDSMSPETSELNKEDEHNTTVLCLVNQVLRLVNLIDNSNESTETTITSLKDSNGNTHSNNITNSNGTISTDSNKSESIIKSPEEDFIIKRRLSNTPSSEQHTAISNDSIHGSYTTKPNEAQINIKNNNSHNEIKNTNNLNEQSNKNNIKQNNTKMYVSSNSESEAEQNWNNLTFPCNCTSHNKILNNNNIKNNFYNNTRSLNRINNYQKCINNYKKFSKALNFDFDSNGKLIKNNNVKNIEENKGVNNKNDNLDNSSSRILENEAINKDIVQTNYNMSITTDSSSEDTDDEYFTPPNSIINNNNNISTSSEEEMIDAIEDNEPDLFLIGKQLSKYDVDLFETINNCNNIDHNNYPYIYKWKHFINIQLNKQNNLNLIISSPGFASPLLINNSNATNNNNSNRSILSSPGNYSPVSTKNSYRPIKHSTPSVLKFS